MPRNTKKMRLTTGASVFVSLFLSFSLILVVFLADLAGSINFSKVFKQNQQPYQYPVVEWVIGYRTNGEGKTAFERQLRSVLHVFSIKQEAEGTISNTGSASCAFLRCW